MGYVCHYYFRDGEVQGIHNLGTYHMYNLANMYISVHAVNVSAYRICSPKKLIWNVK